jgi:two-component system, LytTR family, sensor kinase
MKWVKPSRFYMQCFWLSMPMITGSLMYILYKERIWSDWRVWAITWPIVYGIGYISWRMHVQYDWFLRNKYPSLQQTGKRVFYKFAVNLLIMTPSVLVIFYLFHGFRILGYRVSTEDLKLGYLVGLAVNLIFETLWEVVYIIDKYKEVSAEKDVLEQMQLQEEFDVLKQKVNPHFLFNCFNTLSSLISEDKDRAERFLDELSKVYRYLLRNNEDGMSSLENELNFIDSFFQLLKTRFGEAVKLRVETDPGYSQYVLPSLSLQMLVENAVKHNAHSKSKPLYIEIFTTVGNKLVVNNNLQRRAVKAPGNQVGLDNIRGKYELLHLPGFQVMEDEKNFTVVLPLIWNNNFETRKTDLAEINK